MFSALSEHNYSIIECDAEMRAIKCKIIISNYYLSFYSHLLIHKISGGETISVCALTAGTL